MPNADIKRHQQLVRSEIKPGEESYKHAINKIIGIVDDSCREIRTVSHNMIPNALINSTLSKALTSFVNKLDNKTMEVHLFTEGLPEAATIDVSFISLALILPALKNIIVPGGQVVALVKPQFEAGKDKVGKKGIVRDPATHVAVLEKIAAMAVAEGFSVKGATYSPVTGGEGNIEFLYYLVAEDPAGTDFSTDDFKQLVKQAHSDLT